MFLYRVVMVRYVFVNDLDTRIQCTCQTNKIKQQNIIIVRNIVDRRHSILANSIQSQHMIMTMNVPHSSRPDQIINFVTLIKRKFLYAQIFFYFIQTHPKWDVKIDRVSSLVWNIWMVLCAGKRSNHCYHHVTISRKAHEINQIVTAFICQWESVVRDIVFIADLRIQILITVIHTEIMRIVHLILWTFINQPRYDFA